MKYTRLIFKAPRVVETDEDLRNWTIALVAMMILPFVGIGVMILIAMFLF